MERKDAMSLVFEEVEVLDTPAIYTDWRIIRDSVPKGLHLYELRHEDEDWGEPCQLAKGILVNYYGSILTSTPLQLDADGRRTIERKDFAYTRSEVRSTDSFLKKYPPQVPDLMELDVYKPGEQDLFFSQEKQDCANGCIGHLRGDFGNGSQFYHDWFPHQNNRLNREPFKSDLQRVVDWLRQDYSPLKDLRAMKSFCGQYWKTAPLPNAILPSYGFRIDTQRFQYMLRCFPEKGDYNFYIYCYDKQAREQERTEQKKNTRPPAKKRHEPER